MEMRFGDITIHGADCIRARAVLYPNHAVLTIGQPYDEGKPNAGFWRNINFYFTAVNFSKAERIAKAINEIMSEETAAEAEEIRAA